MVVTREIETLMKLAILTFLSLQLIVAPVCQAAVNCAPAVFDTHHQNTADHDGQFDLMAGDQLDLLNREMSPGSECDHCDEASVARDSQFLAMLPGTEIEPAADLAGFVLGAAMRGPQAHAPPGGDRAIIEPLWMRTQRIRL